MLFFFFPEKHDCKQKYVQSLQIALLIYINLLNLFQLSRIYYLLYLLAGLTNSSAPCSEILEDIFPRNSLELSLSPKSCEQEDDLLFHTQLPAKITLMERGPLLFAVH